MAADHEEAGPQAGNGRSTSKKAKTNGKHPPQDDASGAGDAFIAAGVAGFGSNVIPVIPPGAAMAPRADNRPVPTAGKAPGLLRQHGWVGYWKWEEARLASSTALTRWAGWHANMGWRCGPNGHYGLDLDINDPAVVAALREEIERVLGVKPLWRRVDHEDHHKVLGLVQVVEDVTGGPVETLKGSDIRLALPDGAVAMVQLLGRGKQFVAAGIHPDRLRPYAWGLPGAPWQAPVPAVTQTQIDALWRALPGILEGLNCTKVGKAGSVATASSGAQDPDWEPARCDREGLEQLLAQIPNDGDKVDGYFSDTGHFVAMCHAIKNASGGADWGFEAWERWANQVEQDLSVDNHFQQIWERETIYRMDANTLRTWARQRQPVPPAREVFPDLTVEEKVDLDRYKAGTQAKRKGRWDLWREALARLRAAYDEPGSIAPTPASGSSWLINAQSAKRRTRVKPFVTDRHRRGTVSALIAAPGVGKSTLSFTTALAIVHGCGDVLRVGMTVDWVGAVIIVSNEEEASDSEAVLQAAERELGLTRESMIYPVGIYPERLIMVEKRDEVVQPTLDAIRFVDRLTELRASNGGTPIALVVFDTLSACTADLNENSSSDMQIAMNIFTDLARAAFSAVELVHHTNKTSQDAEGMWSFRGSTAILGAVRLMATMVPVEDAPSLVKLTVVKSGGRGFPPIAHFARVVTSYVADDPRGAEAFAAETAAILKPVAPPQTAADRMEEIMAHLRELVRQGIEIRDVDGGTRQGTGWVALTKAIKDRLGLTGKTAGETARAIRAELEKTGRIRIEDRFTDKRNAVRAVLLQDSRPSDPNGDDEGSDEV